MTELKVSSDNPRRAGVSSFGIGGTNAHAILEEASQQPVISHPERPAQLFVMSAKTKASLARSVKNLGHFIHDQKLTDMPSIAHTMQVRRTHWEYRTCLVGSDANQVSKSLQKISVHEPSFVNPELTTSLIFMFSVQGAQYVNMGLALYQSEPLFTQTVNQCCKILYSEMHIDLLSILYPSHKDEGETRKKILQTQYAQLGLFVIEYAMSELFLGLGVKPVALMGHSIGEYVAATVAGVFSLRGALCLVTSRGRLMQSMPSGAMLSVACSYDDLQLILPNTIDISAVNGPQLCVISGAFEAIIFFEKKLSNSGISYSRLHTSHAFHSRMMLPVYNEYKDLLDKIKKNKPQIPLLSNTTGTWMTEEQAKSSQYWCQHIMMTVLFYQGLQTAFSSYDMPYLIELGPGRTCVALVKQ